MSCLVNKFNRSGIFYLALLMVGLSGLCIGIGNSVNSDASKEMEKNKVYVQISPEGIKVTNAHYLTRGDILLISTKDMGILRTRNAGKTWEVVLATSSYCKLINVHGTTHSSIYVYSQNKSNYYLWKSTDTGMSWKEIGEITSKFSTAEQTFFCIYNIVSHPTDSKIVLCCTWCNIFVSYDSGENWKKSKIQQIGEEPTQVVFSPKGEYFFVAKDNGGLIRNKYANNFREFIITEEKTIHGQLYFLGIPQLIYLTDPISMAKTCLEIPKKYKNRTFQNYMHWGPMYGFPEDWLAGLWRIGGNTFAAGSKYLYIYHNSEPPHLEHPICKIAIPIVTGAMKLFRSTSDTNRLYLYDGYSNLYKLNLEK